MVFFSKKQAYNPKIEELVARNMKNKYHRMIVDVILLGVIILILGWAATGPE